MLLPSFHSLYTIEHKSQLLQSAAVWPYQIWLAYTDQAFGHKFSSLLFRCGMLHPPLNLCYGSNYVTLSHGCNVKLYLSFNIALSMRTTVIKEELYCHDNDLANLSLVDIRLNSI